MTNRYCELEITALYESPHNPRRHFDDAKLKELADNIAEVGIMQPLIVRQDLVKAGTAPRYEIAAGHRRYRAAKMAKLSMVPCLVREMTDQQFMEFLNIENLQREDVHPLDEAKGYEVLMAAPYKMKVETIAAKVGKSIKYVYDSKKLLELTKAAQQLFWDGVIDKGHAILLARLTSAQQAAAIGTKDEAYADGGLLRLEQRLYDEDDDRAHLPVKAVSVRELEDWIKRHIRFAAHAADPVLYPETVGQVTAAKKTNRKIIEITHEYLADDAVRHADEAKVYGERAWQRADGQEGSTTCDRSVLGVIASGPGQGQAFDVCVNKDRCLVHWGKEIRAREKRAKEKEKGTAPTATTKKDSEAAQRIKDEAARARWSRAKPAIWAAVATRVAALPVTPTGELLSIVLERVPSSTRKAAEKYFPCGKDPKRILQFLAFLRLYEEINNEYWAVRDFPARADRLMVDLKAILKERAPEPAPPAVHTSAPKTKGKKK